MKYDFGDMWVEIDKNFTKAWKEVEAEVKVDVEVHTNGDTQHVGGGGVASIKVHPPATTRNPTSSRLKTLSLCAGIWEIEVTLSIRRVFG